MMDYPDCDPMIDEDGEEVEDDCPAYFDGTFFHCPYAGTGWCDWCCPENRP